MKGGHTLDQNRFQTPVAVLTGLGVPTPVRNVDEAYALLLDWPGFERNAGHTLALRACKAALAGEIEAETARGAFLAFARRTNSLVPDVDEVVAPNQLNELTGTRAV